MVGWLGGRFPAASRKKSYVGVLLNNILITDVRMLLGSLHGGFHTGLYGFSEAPVRCAHYLKWENKFAHTHAITRQRHTCGKIGHARSNYSRVSPSGYKVNHHHLHRKHGALSPIQTGPIGGLSTSESRPHPVYADQDLRIWQSGICQIGTCFEPYE